MKNRILATLVASLLVVSHIDATSRRQEDTSRDEALARALQAQFDQEDRASGRTAPTGNQSTVKATATIEKLLRTAKDVLPRENREDEDGVALEGNDFVFALRALTADDAALTLVVDELLSQAYTASIYLEDEQTEARRNPSRVQKGTAVQMSQLSNIYTLAFIKHGLMGEGSEKGILQLVNEQAKKENFSEYDGRQVAVIAAKSFIKSVGKNIFSSTSYGYNSPMSSLVTDGEFMRNFAHSSSQKSTLFKRIVPAKVKDAFKTYENRPTMLGKARKSLGNIGSAIVRNPVKAIAGAAVLTLLAHEFAYNTGNMSLAYRASYEARREQALAQLGSWKDYFFMGTAAAAAPAGAAQAADAAAQPAAQAPGYLATLWNALSGATPAAAAATAPVQGAAADLGAGTDADVAGFFRPAAAATPAAAAPVQGAAAAAPAQPAPAATTPTARAAQLRAAAAAQQQG